MHDEDRHPVSARLALAAVDVSVQYESLRSAKHGGGLLEKARLVRSRTTKYGVRNATLVAYEGERIGLIGRNGSGKSTILRALAGLERISSGEVFARSQPVLLSVSPALIPERTGNENIDLGLLAMGLSPAEASETRPRVAELADLGGSLDDPIKTYSSGMGSRLRFAIAAMNPGTDILLIDEALGTGDAAFQDRSEAAIDNIVSNAGTLFFVSHTPSAVVKMCERAIWMYEGRPIMDGPSREVALTYQNWSNLTVAGEAGAAREIIDEVTRQYETPQIEIL